MRLTIDRGNSFIKLGVWREAEVIYHLRLRSLSDEQLQVILDTYKITSAILSQVADVSFSLSPLEELDTFIILDHTVKSPITTQYARPETWGKDRLAVCVGAHNLWPDSDKLIIDTGTCITYDICTKGGKHLGGQITPGPELRFQAMHTGTYRLPLVTRDESVTTPAITTESALQVGGLYGCIREIEGWITYYSSQIEDLIVVISGGDADYFASQMKSSIFVRPDLLQVGLYEILILNEKI